MKLVALANWALATGLVIAVFLLVFTWPRFSPVRLLATPAKHSQVTFSLCGMVRKTCVVDGDTFWLDGEKIRIVNIDAPETPGSARCKELRFGKNPSWCDYSLGIKARDGLLAFLSGGEMEIFRQGQDKYGRTLANVAVNGRDAGDYLIANGLARAWQN